MLLILSLLDIYIISMLSQSSAKRQMDNKSEAENICIYDYLKLSNYYFIVINLKKKKLQIFSSSQKGSKGPERRKSSVAFSSVLLDYEKEEMNSNDSYKEEHVNQDGAKAETYFFPSGARPSVFSRISEMSFQTLSTKYQYIFVMFSFLMIFFIGIVVGALSVKFVFCSTYVQDNFKIGENFHGFDFVPGGLS